MKRYTIASRLGPNNEEIPEFIESPNGEYTLVSYAKFLEGRIKQLREAIPILVRIEDRSDAEALAEMLISFSNPSYYPQS